MSEKMEWFEMWSNGNPLTYRILAESCESCLQAEFAYVCTYGTFVCEECV